MPPPRLSRHLRPCHLPVTARQVRCVQTTGRANLSNTGYDTTPQTPSTKVSNAEGNAPSHAADTKNKIPGEEKSWWRKVLGSIASFGKHGGQFESIESRSGRLPPHIEQPERPAIDPQETRQDSRRDEQGPAKPIASSTKSQQDEESQKGQMRFADRRKNDFASAGQVDMTAIQQQIYQLSQQLKALEARFEGGSPTGQPSFTSAGEPRTLAIRSDPTQSNVYSQDPAYLQQTPSRILMSTREMSADVLRLWKRAHAVYTRSVSRYWIAAAELARWPGHLVAPVAPSILRHFLSMRRIALMDDDISISDILVKFRLTVERLESFTRNSSMPVPTINDPLVADEVARYSKMMSYDNPISHTLDAGLKRYRISSRKLSEIATELDSFQSPMVAPIANRAREQLLAIGNYAAEEGEPYLMELIESYQNSESATPKLRQSVQANTSASTPSSVDSHEKDVRNEIANSEDDGQRLMRRIHTQSRSMTSSTDLKTNSKDRGLETRAAEQRLKIKDSISSNRLSNPEVSTTARITKSPKPAPRTDEVSEQSLLEELFPETNRMPQPQPTKKNRDQYPRLQLPKSPIRPVFLDRSRTQAAGSIGQHGEHIAVLQLTNCSTGLTIADFRRIIPKGKHLEGWRRDSDFYKVIPGRDPLSLERLPFYYLLFKNAEAALSYQKNASRLHKLSARYQPSSILSAIPPPKGFLEDGEDIAAAVASYNLLPKNHSMSLNVLMQPYNPALRQLIERGGYQPIATSHEEVGKRICRVLLHIEGYEPSPSDLFAAITRDAYNQGILHPLRNESQSSIHRLRDVINLKMSSKAVSSSRPRAYGTFDHSGAPQTNSTSSSELTYDDPEIQSMMGGAEEDRSQAQMNQEVMNRVYNRWVLDFEDADTARRWSLRWHRRTLPDVATREPTWKDAEEARICNTEVLW